MNPEKSSPSSFEMLTATGNAIKRVARDLSNSSARQVTTGQITGLQLLYASQVAEGTGLTMTDFSKKMGHSTAAATGAVDALEKLGLVERRHAKEDRRKVLAFLTKKGLAIMKTLEEYMEEELAALRGDLVTA